MEGTTTTPEGTAAAPDGTTTAPVYYNADGTLAEGWQSTLPEGYREEASLSTVKDAKVLAKMFVDTKRMVGKNTIALPTDASTEAEWEEYYKAGGRPETVADYGLKAPDGMDAEVSEKILPKEQLAKWQERFFRGGISKKAAEQFVADFVQDMAAEIQSKQQAEKLARDELVSGLAAEWGAAFEQKKHLGNMAIEEGTIGDLDFKNRLTGKFGNDPDFIKYSANLGSKFAEGKSPDFTQVPTPTDLQAQINAIEANPLYLKGTTAQRMKLAEQVLALRTKIKMQTKTTP